MIKEYQVWQHVETGKEYQFIREVPFKNPITREWETIVLYSPVLENGHSDLYARVKEDFENKFNIIPDLMVAEDREEIGEEDE